MSPPGGKAEDYLHQVYAGVLGKLIGVYLGRPFENWTYQHIVETLGPIHYYVHDKFGLPCVVIDDDISGTFTFIKAIEEHGFDLTSELVGKTWLNNVIEKRNVFWWGGNGISTEHTAYLNLKKGISAPDSGSIQTNGQTVAEQIGAQIFIDGWAMICPGQPRLAARYAGIAARVSHDGEAVHAAKLWAAMEAEAFVSKDVDHLLDVGLACIPSESEIAKLIATVRLWVLVDNDWHATRQKIQDEFGYDKYSGICHVMPNHGIMIMALLYAGHDFDEAMHIINTSGWDTDCNSGNVGCIVAIMHGLKALGPEAYPARSSSLTRKKDWRDPIADRVLISSADGGDSITDAARLAYRITNLGLRLADRAPLDVPKQQFHFSLPYSVQGFRLRDQSAEVARLEWDRSRLMVTISKLDRDMEPVFLSTDTFTPEDVLQVSRHYGMSACPLLYPGQIIAARVSAGSPIDLCIRMKAYTPDNRLMTLDGEKSTIHDYTVSTLEWTIPACLQNMPIQQVGIAISTSSPTPLQGIVWLESLSWSGTPTMRLERPVSEANDLHSTEEETFWERSWISSVDKFQTQLGPSFYLAHDRGEGLISHGTREWEDYGVKAQDFAVHLGAPAGVLVRFRGLNRWYALMFLKGQKIALVKARDEERKELATKAFEWKLDQRYRVKILVKGRLIAGSVDGVMLSATDDEYQTGGIGLVCAEGAVSADTIDIGPLPSKITKE